VDLTVEFDCLAIGNAIVDIYAQEGDDFLIQNGIIKGAMNLIDVDRARLLQGRMGESVKSSGGSAANTAAGIASLGGKAAFMGKIAFDHLGQVFAHDLRGQGVAYDTPPLDISPLSDNQISTAHSMIFITPDGERSMNTYLGACVEFGPEDVEISKVAAAKITYFEGYLWDPPRAREAIRLALRIAHERGRKVAISLSDPFCVDRYRDEFLALIQQGEVDIVIANEAELKSLYQCQDLDVALRAIRADCHHIAVITRGDKGSIIVQREANFSVPAVKVDKIVDTTGAGDLYASGFLYGYAHGFSLHDAARLGSLAASLIIQQVGSRPNFSLREVALSVFPEQNIAQNFIG